MTDFKYLYFLTKVDGLGAIRIKKLLETYGNAKNVFDLTAQEIIKNEGLSHKTAESIVSSKSSFDIYEKEYLLLLEMLDKKDISVVTIEDKDYPVILSKIYDPPVFLYYRGKLQEGKSFNDTLLNSIGIVGTRKPTDYGKNISEMFAKELSSLGINIISGFARGVDTAVHKAVIDNKDAKGITAAIFGNGVDVIYPPENKKLYDKMLENGLLISEYDISANPDSGNFPKRNRIISGLSLGVIIIESGEEGGALITARCALDQSREVFAVPGYITSKYSTGTNRLIKNGQAKLVQNVDDVLEEISMLLENISLKSNGQSKFSAKFSERELPNLKGNEKLIFDTILNSNEPVHIDAISENTGLNISDCLITLLNLEFKGNVNQLPGKRFQVN